MHDGDPVKLIFVMINTLFIMLIEVYYIQTRMYVNSFLAARSKFTIKYLSNSLTSKTQIKILIVK